VIQTILRIGIQGAVFQGGHYIFVWSTSGHVQCRTRQKIVASYVTESELVVPGQVTQYMMFVMRLMESIGLKIKKSLILTVDNKRTVDLINNWSCGGRTRYMDARKLCFKRT
jgi:hypothetical protein